MSIQLLVKNILFKAIHFSHTVLIKKIQFSISTDFLHIFKCQNISILNISV